MKLTAYSLSPFVRKTRLGLLWSIALLSGCSWQLSTPPEAPSLPTRWVSDTGQSTFGQTATRDFWSSLGDPALPGLLDRAFRHNHDLKLSGLQMKLTQIQASLTGLSRWPDVSLGGNAGMSRPLDNPDGIISRSSGLGASLSYPLDIWGYQLAQREAADIDAQASETDWQAARLALSVSVAQAHWQLGYLNRALTNARSDLADATNTLNLAQIRYRAGATSGSDVVFARQALAGQQSALSQSQQLLTEARFAFAVLMGEAPESRQIELEDLTDTPLPVPDAGLPADILSRRPDVHAAELRVRSSLASADAVRLSFYPQLTLTGSLGTASSTLTNYLANPVGSLAAALSLPFVQFNTARFNKEAAKIRYEMAVINFKKTIYTALQDTENALSARQQLSEQAQFLQDYLAQSREAERLTQVRWQQGSTDIQPWLDAQRARRQAGLSLLQNTLARKNNAVQLYAALGGNYQAASSLSGPESEARP